MQSGILNGSRTGPSPEELYAEIRTRGLRRADWRRIRWLGGVLTLLIAAVLAADWLV
jgi:hypothetical protein